MRKLFGIFFLLAGSLSAQTTTFNGILKGTDFSVVQTGQVSFILQPASIDTTVSGGARFVPITIFCEVHQPTVVSTAGTGTITVVVGTAQTWQVGDSILFVNSLDSTLNANTVATPYVITLVNSTTSFNFTQSGTHANGAGGNVGGLYATGGTGGCNVTQNTALTPANTSYKVGLAPNFSQTSAFNTYAIGLGPVDISTVVPTPAQMPSYSFVDLFSNQTIAGNKTFTGTVVCAGICTGFGGGGGSSNIFQVNGVNLLNPATVNFLTSASFNGLTFSFTNTSLGTIQLGALGTLNNAGLTNSSVTVNLAAPGTGGGSVALGSTLNLAIPACVAAGTGHASGLVPDPGATVNLSTFLRSDCTFQVPAGSGNVSNSGTPAVHQVGVWVSATTIEGIPVGTNNQVLHGNTGADPSMSAIVLADLPAAIPNTSLANSAVTINLGAPGTGSGPVSLGSTLNLAMPVCVAAGSSHASGLVPDPGSTVNLSTFLRSDCTFAVPAGGGNVSNSGTPAIHQVGVWVSSTTMEGVSCTSGVLHGSASADPACTAIVDADLPSDMTTTIASGTAALPTTSISSGACTVVSTTATGADPTTPHYDTASVNLSGNTDAVTGYAPSTGGMLTLKTYLTANSLNISVCNNTASAIVPGSASVIWRVIR